MGLAAILRTTAVALSVLVLAACASDMGGSYPTPIVHATASPGSDAGNGGRDLPPFALERSYDCGYGFAMASGDQTQSLELTPVKALIPGADVEVSFPDKGWKARFFVGTDLMVNWCDDAVEPDEPERVVHSAWEITSGTLRFKVPWSLNQGMNSAGSVTAEIEGLEVAGQRIPLPDATITNDAYGFFPG